MRHTRLLTFVSGQYHSDVHKSWVSQCSSTLCHHLQYQGQQPLCSSPNLCYEVLVVSWSSQHSSRMRTPTCDNELCSNQLMSAWVKKLHDAKNLLYSFSSSLAFHKIKQKKDKKKHWPQATLQNGCIPGRHLAQLEALSHAASKETLWGHYSDYTKAFVSIRCASH